MKDLLNFFDKPKDPLSFTGIRISLASPEKIREWSFGEVKSQRRSTTVRLSQNVTGFSAQRSSGQSKTTNVPAENISA